MAEAGAGAGGDAHGRRAATVARAAAALRRGGIVAYPTETFYALGACAEDARAVSRLVGLKGRGAARALPVLCATTEQAAALCAGGALPAAARVLAERFWPGALTIVVPARAGLPEAVAPRGEVGLRVSAHPLARALCAAAGPLVATSANRAGEAPAATAAVVRAAFGGGLDDVAEEDDGVQGRAPSTVVRLPAPLAGGSGATGWSCDILRAGGVAAEAVEAALRAAGR